jgi:hypothetical protein
MSKDKTSNGTKDQNNQNIERSKSGAARAAIFSQFFGPPASKIAAIFVRKRYSGNSGPDFFTPAPPNPTGNPNFNPKNRSW